MIVNIYLSRYYESEKFYSITVKVASLSYEATKTVIKSYIEDNENIQLFKNSKCMCIIESSLYENSPITKKYYKCKITKHMRVEYITPIEPSILDEFDKDEQLRRIILGSDVPLHFIHEGKYGKYNRYITMDGYSYKFDKSKIYKIKSRSILEQLVNDILEAESLE